MSRGKKSEDFIISSLAIRQAKSGQIKLLIRRVAIMSGNQPTCEAFISGSGLMFSCLIHSCESFGQDG